MAVFRYEGPVTPADISASLATLINDLVPGASPQYVDVKPVEGARADDCFPLVEEQVKLHGGRRLIGWALWELPGLFVEAEFHSVWEKPDGELADVTPKQRPTERVLFLHSPESQYTGRQVNNIRHKIRNLPGKTGVRTTTVPQTTNKNGLNLSMLIQWMCNQTL